MIRNVKKPRPSGGFMMRQTCFHCRVFFGVDTVATRKIPLHKVNVCDAHFTWFVDCGRVSKMPTPAQVTS